MDIRSFFGKGGVKTKPKGTSRPSVRSSATSSSSARSDKKRSPQQGRETSARTKTAEKNKRRKNEVEDILQEQEAGSTPINVDKDETTDGENEKVETKIEDTKKRTIDVDSDETTDDGVLSVHVADKKKENSERTSCASQKSPTRQRKKAESGIGSYKVEISAEEFFSSRAGSAEKRQQKKVEGTKTNKRTRIIMSSSSDEDEPNENGDGTTDEDYTENRNKNDSDFDDDFEIQAKRRTTRRSRAKAEVELLETVTGEGGEAESQGSLVTSSSIAPSPLKSSPNRPSRSKARKQSLKAEGECTDDEEAACATPSKKRRMETIEIGEKKTPSPRRGKSSPIKSSTKKKKEPPVRPEKTLDTYSTDLATPECLAGLTFVFSGILPNLSRDDAEDFVKILGGRVTKAVSSRTDYLVVGDELEDGRDVKEGSKYRKAVELGEDVVAILKGEGELYGLTKMLDGRLHGNSSFSQAVGSMEVTEVKTPSMDRSSTDTNPPLEKSSNVQSVHAVVNPYAKKGFSKSNPYAKKASSVSDQHEISRGGLRADVGDPNALWADKYAPSSSRDILGNQESVRKLSTWLAKWEETFNNARSQGKTFAAPNGPWKAALLSGPPGIGKTTTAVLVANESGRDVLELNASDARSKKALSEGLGDVTGSQVLNFNSSSQTKKKKGHAKKRCIIMDEVDGMGAGDRSGISELIKMIKSSKVPIICICNDRQSQKIRSLVTYCLDLRYRRPVKTVIARRAVEVAAKEGMRVEMNAAEAIAESCGNDIRQVLNCLQMWSSKKSRGSSSSEMTYKDLKDRQGFINKDEILRVSMFDATRLIVEGRRNLAGADSKAEKDSLYKRSDAFFTDYSLMGLNVHQNYLKVMISQFQDTKRRSDIDAELKCIERMHEATQSMSDFAVAEHAVRSGDQLWGLLPLCSILAVKTGYHAGGENGGFLSGYPEFAGWLGKNSSRGRKIRLLEELSHHMNYKVSADSCELRLRYIPALRERLLTLMMDQNGAKTSDVIQVMDDYGLDRDDIFENMDEFTMNSKEMRFANLDSKTKAAFTRDYNKGVHKSQALVEEQGTIRTRKKAVEPEVEEAAEVDAVIDDDKPSKSGEDEESDELDAEAIKNLFKKKGSGKNSSGAKGNGSEKKKSKKKSSK